MMNKMHESWNPIKGLLYQEPLITLNEKILPEISYEPRKHDIFNVFETPVKDIKVVILGQDPYPSSRIANGLAFSVNENTSSPISLKNIYKEVSTSIGLMTQDYEVNEIPSGYKTLKHWQEQGVFLLNTALTVETNNAGSHLKYWEQFTKRVISHISLNQPCIWLFWGRKVQEFIPYIKGTVFRVSGYDKETIEYIPINEDYNYILTANHPDSEIHQDNAGFYGCNHFYYVNSILKNKNLKEIKW